MTRVPKSVLPWLGLAVALVLFVLLVARMHPTNWFGEYRDDGLYYSSAKALAEGRSYILASFPGTPPQTKYPVLYPWMLSLVWRCDRSFPANLGASVCLTAVFSAGFLILTFLMLRKWKGVGEWPALVIVTVCASLPAFLTVSGSILSDSLFMLLTLAAVLLADSSTRAGGRVSVALLVGVLAGLSVLTRSVGIAVLAGIVAAGLYRRAFRQIAAVVAGAAPFMLPAVWVGLKSLVGQNREALSGPATSLIGWQQTYAYYTSYPKMWKFCVPNARVFLSLLRGNVGAFLETPAYYWLHPTLKIGTSFVATALSSPLMLLALAGILRQARNDEWKPLHFVFTFYTAILLAWNYPVMDRFLLLFVPLFCVGLWVEGKRLAGLLAGALRAGSLGEKVVAAVISVGFAGLAATAVWNTSQFFRPHLFAEQQAAHLRQDKAQAYEWLRANSLPGDRIVACEDGRVYLYTDRETVMPMAFSSEYHYRHDRRVLDRDLAHMADAAVAVEAHYWLTSIDDFITDEDDAQPRMRARAAQLVSGAPEVFRSADGWVRLYDVTCLAAPRGCAAASK
jgi:4-amino-4-deoxy-L-arabinose transferase-like glycosyltransferase